MRGTKAKRLRRESRNDINRPARSYQLVHPVNNQGQPAHRTFIVGTDTQGKPVTQQVAMTQVLLGECDRREYKMRKKGYDLPAVSRIDFYPATQPSLTR